MLTVSSKDEAEAIVRDAANKMPNETEVVVDVREWPPKKVQSLFDKIISLLTAYKMSLRGVKTDTGIFSKLGIEMDTGNSGIYKGVPVMMTPTADFDTLRFRFSPTK